MLRRSRNAALAALAAVAALTLLPGTAHAAAADLGIVSLTTNPNPISSDTATVTITARNSGDAPAFVVAIRLEPATDDEQIRTVTCPFGFTPNPEIGPNACVWGTMAPGATVTMTATIELGETSTRLASITHTATIAQVTQTGSVPDPTPADLTAVETVPITYDTTINPETGRPGGERGTEDGGTSTAPQIQSLALSPTTFRAAKSGPSAVAAAKAPIGTTVTTKLSADAPMVFRIERARSGRKVGGRCVVPTRRNRSAKRCTRWVTLTGKFTASGEKGTNRLRFSGRLGGLRLAPGSYRLAVTAKDARGRESDARRATFRIVA